MGSILTIDQLAKYIANEHDGEAVAEELATLLYKISGGRLLNYCFYTCGVSLEGVCECPSDGCIMFLYRFDQVETEKVEDSSKDLKDAG